MLEVLKARYEQAYKVWIEFNDGRSGIVDLSDVLWGPIFEPLKDIKLFKRFFISDILHTIAWENGADLAPEYLYKRITNNHQKDCRVSLKPTDAVDLQELE